MLEEKLTEMVTIRMSAQLKEQLLKQASCKKRKLSELIRLILEQSLEVHDDARD